MSVRDYGNQISIFAFGAKSWGISFSNQIHYGEEERELHEFYILEQWPRAMECYQKFSQPKIFTQNQSSIIMRQTTHNIDCVCARIRVGVKLLWLFQIYVHNYTWFGPKSKNTDLNSVITHTLKPLYHNKIEEDFMIIFSHLRLHAESGLATLHSSEMFIS